MTRDSSLNSICMVLTSDVLLSGPHRGGWACPVLRFTSEKGTLEALPKHGSSLSPRSCCGRKTERWVIIFKIQLHLSIQVKLTNTNCGLNRQLTIVIFIFERKNISYHKIPKNSDTRRNCCNLNSIILLHSNGSKRCSWNGKQCRPWSDCS